MFGLKGGLIIGVLLLVVNSAGAAGCGAKGGESASQPQTTNTRTEPTPSPTPFKEIGREGSGELKILAQGAYGSVEEPFVVVARDREVYAALRELAEGLPEVGTDFFKSSVVVAAFLGTRSTGGYSVEIRRAADGRLRISEKAPPKDAMLSQALTQPFKIVSVPVSDEQGVQLQISARGSFGLRDYQVESGRFETGGGIAGRIEKFSLGGSLSIAQHTKLFTALFDLKEAGGKGRVLTGAASGIGHNDGRFSLARIDAGTFVEGPRSPLRAEGELSSDNRKVALKFESLPARVADGFSGRGQLEATAVTP